MSVQSNAFALGERRVPKPTQSTVDVFRDSLPVRPFTAVARLNVHVEKTFFIPTAFNEAFSKLETLTRQHGGGAIIDVKETTSRLNETFIYNVSATAIMYTE